MQVSGTDRVQKWLRVPVTSPVSTKVTTEGKVVVLVVVLIGRPELSRRFVAALTSPAGGY